MSETTDEDFVGGTGGSGGGGDGGRRGNEARYGTYLPLIDTPERRKREEG